MLPRIDGPPEPARYEVLRLRCVAVDAGQTLDAITYWVEHRRRASICFATAHGVMAAQHDAEVARAYAAATYTVPDGMPLVWLGRWQGHPAVGRVYGPTLTLLACERAAAQGWSCYFYGGAEGVAAALGREMSRRFPGLRVAGQCTPPFRALGEMEDAADAERINASGADLVFVGLGCPKQELWMRRMRGRLEAPVLLGVGAAFDFHTGRVRQAPSWMQSAGLEWLFRLAMEPRRLAGRYLLGNSAFIAHVALQRLRLRRYEPPLSEGGD